MSASKANGDGATCDYNLAETTTFDEDEAPHEDFNLASVSICKGCGSIVNEEWVEGDGPSNEDATVTTRFEEGEAPRDDFKLASVTVCVTCGRSVDEQRVDEQ